MSISAPEHVIRKDVTFLPKGFSLEGYKLVFENPTVWRSYRNTILYTVFGTALNMVLTVLAAYPLSREKFVLRRPVSILITITMYVSGGMIPFFIVVTNLGLYNTPLAVILPLAVSAWNIIIARSFYEEIPEALAEAAQINRAEPSDGSCENHAAAFQTDPVRPAFVLCGRPLEQLFLAHGACAEPAVSAAPGLLRRSL